MNAFRPALLALCLALPCLAASVVSAAEPAAKVQGKAAPAAKAPAKAAAKPLAKTPAKAKPAAKSTAKPKAQAKGKAVSKAVAKPLPKPRLDLTLPKDMVNKLEPDVGDAPVKRKPVLPSMFPTKAESDDSPFQLNGRLISNEMQLQLRNDSRRDVEGAAIDFEFRN